MYIFFILSMFFLGNGLICSELVSDCQQHTQLILVPGLTMKPEFLKTMAMQMLPQFKEHVSVANAPSGCYADLGQSYCTHDFNESVIAILSNNTIEQAIIFASSQGSASVINSLVKNKNEKIKVLIVEGILTSGNHAIVRRFEKIAKYISYIPLSNYLLPYLGKLRHPFYSPAGDQAILNIENLPKDLVVIMLHSKNDPKVSFDEALAFYAGMKNHGNPVYLISKDSDKGEQHHGLFYSDGNGNEYAKEIAAINSILRHHGLSCAKNTSDIDLAPYQPDPVFDAYKASVEREKRMQWFDIGMKSLIALSAMMYVVYIIIKNKRCLYK
jgi:hypothetical protein